MPVKAKPDKEKEKKGVFGLLLASVETGLIVGSSLFVRFARQG